MDLDPDAVLVPYVYEESCIRFHRVLDGEVTAEVPLGHAVIKGTSQDDMIVTIGYSPDSMIIISDYHTPDEQQTVLLSHWPKAVAISPAKDTIAVMFKTGLLLVSAIIALIIDRLVVASDIGCGTAVGVTA